MAKKIDIQINKAEITGFEVRFNEGDVDVTATVGLYAGGKKISSFTLGTKSWDDRRFDLPVQLVAPIKDIASKLETILVRECSSAIGELASGEI